jgi:hypothetical protein
MNCYQIDPMTDARWDKFVAMHPQASVFHTRGWLDALQKTYGYEPIAFTTSRPSDEVRNAVVFCQIKSWLTGHRLVSLPFSDHCELLSDSDENIEFLLHHVRSTVICQGLRYLEIRPAAAIPLRDCEKFQFLPTSRYVLHTLDLRPDLDTVFLSLDKDSVRRRVKRAERAGLMERCGRTESLIQDFYKLFVLTRRRLHIPPSPIKWFRNLVNCLGDALEIRVAYRQDTPVAAVLILHFRETAYYKYGCAIQTPWLHAMDPLESDCGSKIAGSHPIRYGAH